MFRKSDFFYECDPGDKMGFPPGYNRNLMLYLFDRFQEEHYKRFPKKDPAEYEKKLKVFKEQEEKKKIKNEPKA